MNKGLITAIYALSLLLLTAYPSPASSSSEIQVEVLDESISVQQYDASGDQLLLYIAPGYGFTHRGRSIAKKLSALGVEVWMVDLAENFFLPIGNRSIRKFDGRYVAGLVEQAHKRSGKNVTLLTSSYGAIPVLRGARKWQLNNKNLKQPYLGGAILFSPELFQGIPALGVDPSYVPIATATNVPVMIYQNELRNNRWHLDAVVSRLKRGGAEVYQKIIPGVVGFFYEIDELPPTQKALKKIPLELPGVIKLLQSTPTPLAATKIKKTVGDETTNVDIELREYKGNKTPLGLDLVDINGKRYVRKSYEHRVTVVNFWATWCPPCIHEIPSLNRLTQKMHGHNFELISVNFGEEENTIRQFLKKVNVTFPVLLDNKGRVAGKWNTVTLPSTFVIGPDGRFAYAVNAAIDWDSSSVVAALKKLAKK